MLSSMQSQDMTFTAAIMILFCIILYYKFIWIPASLLSIFRRQAIPIAPRNFPFGQSLDIFFNRRYSSIKSLYFRNREMFGNIYVMFLGVMPLLNTTDPSLIKQILVTKHMYYERSDAFKAILSLLSGNSLIVMDGKQHRQIRKIFTPSFSHNAVDDMATKFVSCCENTIQTWTKQQKSAVFEMDMFDEFTKLTMDCLCSICLGYECKHEDSVEKKEEICTEVGEALRWLQNLFAFYHPFFRRFFSVFGIAVTKDGSKSLHTLAEEAVEKYVRKYALDQSYPDDLLGNMLKHTYEESPTESFTRRQLIDNIKLFLIVGHDTTTSSLSWTMYLLAQYPEYQERIRASILEVCGKDLPTRDHIQKLPLLSMVIYESLRMFPPVVGVIRRAICDHQLGDYVIPKGTVVATSSYAMHYDPSLWKEDPTVFNPERFRDGTAGAVHHPMAFLPFGAGKQNCIGQRFAILQMHLIIAMMLRSFRVSKTPQAALVEPVLRLSLKSKNGMRLRLEKLDQEFVSVSNMNQDPRTNLTLVAAA